MRISERVNRLVDPPETINHVENLPQQDSAERASNSVVLVLRLRQQPISVGYMYALQRFQLLKDRPRNRAIETLIFLT